MTDNCSRKRGPMRRPVIGLLLLLRLSVPPPAQWPVRTSPGLPRAADGTVNLAAPAPRTSHGRPTLSGLWIPEPDPNGIREGVEYTIFPRYLFNVTQDVKDRTGMLLPAAEEKYR